MNEFIKNKNSKLHILILKENIFEIKKLLNNENKIINVQNKQGDTPLHLSIRYQMNDISKILINQNNINLKIKNIYQNDILFEALISENNYILDLLLKLDKYKINHNFKSFNNTSYFHYAIKTNNNIFLKYLLNIKNLENYKDSNGNSLLHYAANYERIDYLNLLKKFNFDFDIKNNFDENVLNYYIKSKKKKF